MKRIVVVTVKLLAPSCMEGVARRPGVEGTRFVIIGYRFVKKTKAY